MLESKIEKGIEYTIGWKSKNSYISKLTALHGVFLPNIKYFGVKTGIQFNNNPLATEQINYARKIVQVYIVYDLGNWILPKNLLINFTLKDCLFWATDIVKNSDKQKYMYSGHGIVFDGKGEYNLVIISLKML